VRTMADNEASKVASKKIDVSRNSYIFLIKSRKALPFLSSSRLSLLFLKSTEPLPPLQQYRHVIPPGVDTL